MRSQCLLIVFVLVASGSSLCATEVPIDFRAQIAPILEQHCVRCHSPANSKGDVSLATIEDLRASEYVIAGDPKASYLIELVTSIDGEPPAMPQEADPLSGEQVDLLRQLAELDHGLGAVGLHQAVVEDVVSLQNHDRRAANPLS